MPHVSTAGFLANSASTLANSWSIPLTAGCAVGQAIVVVVSAHASAGEDNNFAATDSKGNTWSEAVHVLQTGNVQMSILWCKPTTALVSGDTIGLTHGGTSTGSVTATADVFDDIQTLDVTQSSSSGSATTVSTGTTATGAQASQLVIGGFGWKVIAGTNDTSFTPGSGYTNSTVRQSSVSGGTYRNVVLEWAYTSSVATRSGSGTVVASSYAGAAVVFNTSTPAQDAAPATDITTTGWTTTPSGTVASVIDETTPSDTDYATSPSNPSSSVLEVKFAPLGVPSSLTGHVLRVRMRANNFTTNTVRVDLYQGATLIANLAAAQVLTTSFVTYSFSLTSGQAGAITDYTDLRFRLTATAA
jgi:hypothetical protein